LVTIAQVTFGIAVASWFIIRNSPAQVGLRLIEELNGRNSLRVGKARDSSGLSLAQRFNIVLSNKNVWALFLQGFGTYGAYSTMFHNWGVVYVMQTYSVPRDFAANFVLIATIGLIAGAPVAGFLSDRIFRKRRLPLILFTGISLASFLLLTLWNGGRPPLEALYPLCFFVGFGTGAIAIKFASIKDMVQPSVQGIASGLVNIGGFASAAVAQPVFGYILDQGWVGDMMEGARVYPLQAFQQGLWLCCALTVLGLLGALLVKETHRHGSL
jgi:sugar phosphate permease